MIYEATKTEVAPGVLVDLTDGPYRVIANEQRGMIAIRWQAPRHQKTCIRAVLPMTSAHRIRDFAFWTLVLLKTTTATATKAAVAEAARQLQNDS